MAEAKEKWDEVGERFGDLGRTLKDRFDAERHVRRRRPREGERRVASDLGDALDAGFTTIGETLRETPRCATR